MTIVNPVDLDTITLQFGAHEGPDLAGGACLLEAVAYIAGEPWSDHPECVCPVLAAFGRAWNDALDDEARNRILKPFIPRLIGTRSTPDVQDARAFMAADWAVRTYTPVWLCAAGLDAEAAELEALPALSTTELCKAAMPTIGKAREKAAAARSAATAAAWDVVRDAARAAAMAEATGDAAGAAAWDAAGDAAGDAARGAARGAARATAGDAAMAAANTAARAARAAAMAEATGAASWIAARVAEGAASWTAARVALQPHVELLQTSAARLFDRMIEVAA